MSTLILYSDSPLFSLSLKRFFQAGEYEKILRDKFGIQGDDILCADSLAQVEAIVEKKKVSLIVIDLDVKGKTEIQLLKWIRSKPTLRLKAQAIVTSFICLENLLDDPENSILGCEKGHYFVKKPLPFGEMKRQLEIAKPLCDDELNEVIDKHCSLMGVFEQVFEQLSSSLQTENREDIRRPAKKLRLLLRRHLNGYLNQQIEYLDKTQLIDLRESISKALKAQSFHGLFHGSKYDIRTMYSSARMIICNFLSGGAHDIRGVVRIPDHNKWQPELESEVSNIRHRLEASFGYNSPYLEDISEIQSALEVFKEYNDYVNRLRNGGMVIDIDMLKQRSKATVTALDNIGDNISKIQKERVELRKG